MDDKTRSTPLECRYVNNKRGVNWEAICYQPLSLILLVWWVAGVVLAKGFISTFCAICFGPFWAWYLVIAKIMEINGWL